MSSLTSTTTTIYIEISVFAVSGVIISAILTIEAISWYFEAHTACMSNESEDTEPSNAQNKQTNNAHTTSANAPAATVSNSSISVRSRSPSTSASSSTSNSDTIARILPIITYVSYICYAVTAITAKLGIGIHRECNALALALPSFFYMISKSCLYLVLLYRIYLVYGNSVFKKSTKMLKMFAIFIIFWGLLISILNVILLDVKVMERDGSLYCIQTSHSVLILAFIVLDTIINIGCCYSFTRPLLWLSAIGCIETTETKTMYNMVIQYTVLTVVTVSSTFLTLLILASVNIQWITALDVTINSVCIMLFNKHYHACYECLCCGSHKIGYCISQMECCCGRRMDVA